MRGEAAAWGRKTCMRFPGLVEMLLAWRWQLLWCPECLQLSSPLCALALLTWNLMVKHSRVHAGLFLCWHVRHWFWVSELWRSLSLKPCVCFQYEELSWGPDACPCVQGIQGSSLFPVNVARKITLLGKNFHLYQVAHHHQHWETVLMQSTLGTLSIALLKIHVRHSCSSA